MQHLYEYGAMQFEHILELIEEMRLQREAMPVPALDAEGAARVFAAFR